ncbi:MAG: hypothetical protein JWR69_4726, partial [Pedosphaera sp.]|nr:hypothetical protein [Pedosphaera sp.]
MLGQVAASGHMQAQGDPSHGHPGSPGGESSQGLAISFCGPS